MRGRARWLAIALFVGASAACGLSLNGTGPGALGTGDEGGSSSDDEAGVDGSVGVDGSQDASRASDAASSGDAGDAGDAGPGISPIFGVTADSLYRLDLASTTLTKVGPLTGCVAITDIALDVKGVMMGSGAGLYTIDPKTGTCTEVAAIPQPFTLSFVPKGTVSPTSEALIAFLGADYDEVNRGDGAVTTLTQLAINPYLPSGDVVSAEDAGTFVSVTYSGCATDCILEVRPSDGTIVKDWGASGSLQVFGLALSRGVLYGFLGSGDIVRFTFSGSTVTSTVLPIAEKPLWIGAGSSTHQ